MVNIFLRLIKFIISSLVEKPKKESSEDEKYCSVFNILFPIIHAINGALFLTLLLLSQKYGFYYNYASSLLQDVQLLLTIIELVSLFFSLIISYTLFNWGKPILGLEIKMIFCLCCIGYFCDENIKRNKTKKKEILNQLKEIELESKPIKSILENNKDILEKIIVKIRNIKANEEKRNYNLYILKKFEEKMKKLNDIKNIIEKLKIILS